MRNKFLLATFVWVVFITYMCLAKASDIPEASWLNIPHKDKIVHWIFYLVLTFLLCENYKLKNGDVKKAWLWAFLTAITYGVIIEICQGLLTAERSADPMDALANTLGSALAIFVLWLRQKRKQ